MIIINKTKRFIRTILSKDVNHDFEKEILDYYVNYGVINALKFNYDDYKIKVLGFLKKMKCGEFEYKYSDSCSIPNLYSSMYACMTLGLLGEMDKLTQQQKKDWTEYFDSFQSESDGLFYDLQLRNEIYDNTDWWGARHLSALILMAYNYLGHVPKYSFRFKENDEKILYDKIYKTDWNSPISGANDIDNFLMNVLVLLIYERDHKRNLDLSKNIDDIFNTLSNLINKKTCMWGNYNTNKPNELSRMIQFYYHLLPILLHENKVSGNINSIIRYTLNTQNILGGYGVSFNSSACEDIDSIYVLIKLVNRTYANKENVNNSILKAFAWVLANQNFDGGFVFKRNSGFQYGHKEMSAMANESEMHSTWFRTLSIAFITKYLGIENKFKLNNNLLNYSY